MIRPHNTQIGEQVLKRNPAQGEYLREHALIPDDTTVHGYVYEVESDALRRPGERVAEAINTRENN